MPFTNKGIWLAVENAQVAFGRYPGSDSKPRLIYSVGFL